MANTFPDGYYYTKDHEWAQKQGDLVRVGITSYAVDQLGDVTLVDLSTVGTQLGEHDHFGDIESVKTVSELFAPMEGEIVEVNSELENTPELVNENPYEKGWMIVLKPSSIDAISGLMDAAAYQAYVDQLD